MQTPPRATVSAIHCCFYPNRSLQSIHLSVTSSPPNRSPRLRLLPASLTGPYSQHTTGTKRCPGRHPPQMAAAISPRENTCSARSNVLQLPPATDFPPPPPEKQPFPSLRSPLPSRRISTLWGRFRHAAGEEGKEALEHTLLPRSLSPTTPEQCHAIQVSRPSAPLRPRSPDSNAYAQAVPLSSLRPQSYTPLPGRKPPSIKYTSPGLSE